MGSPWAKDVYGRSPTHLRNWPALGPPTCFPVRWEQSGGGMASAWPSWQVQRGWGWGHWLIRFAVVGYLRGTSSWLPQEAYKYFFFLFFFGFSNFVKVCPGTRYFKITPTQHYFHMKFYVFPHLSKILILSPIINSPPSVPCFPSELCYLHNIFLAYVFHVSYLFTYDFQCM